MSYIENKDKNTILKEMYGTAQPGSTVHEQQKMAIIVRCTEDIETAMKVASESANKLSKKMYALNWILALATLIGALATALMTFKVFCPTVP